MDLMTQGTPSQLPGPSPATSRPSIRTRATVTRRSHRKSRNGCRQCKQRHMKCDEHHPVCVNCSTASQPCSFSNQLPPIPTPSVSTSASTSPLPWSRTLSRDSPVLVVSGTQPSSKSEVPTSSMGTTSFSPVASPAATPDYGISAPGVGGDEDSPKFSLSHLALLHHLERAKFATLLSVDPSAMAAFFDMIFRTAVSAPYLMDEILAFSALHLSTLQEDAVMKARYRQQATELQTRALTQFNSSVPEVEDSNCLAMFIFSSMLGLHTLFDTGAAFDGDLSNFLDSFVRYLSVHRGVRTVVRNKWDLIRNTEMNMLINPVEHVDRMQQPAADCRARKECEKLMGFLSSLTSDSTLVKVCREAVDGLTWVLERHYTLDLQYRTHAVAAWPVMLTAEYIELLNQRRPEALVILAHWAVFLHRDRHYWLYGDTGRILILAITKHLGSYWDKWLAWPKEVLLDD